MRTRLLITALAALASASIPAQNVSAPAAPRQTPKTDFGSVMREGAQATNFGVLLGEASALQQAVDGDAARSAAAAQAFGTRLAGAERRELQGACAGLVANEDDARAKQRLTALLARYKNTAPETVLRFCLDNQYGQLRSDVAASVRAVERAARGEAQANVDLQNALQQQQRAYTTLSNVMKMRHDVAKNAINNVR